MTRTYEFETLEPNEWQIPFSMTLGKSKFTDFVTICCPNEKSKGKKHLLRYNGHDTSVKGSPQQIVCSTCRKSFYPHTSRFFKDLKRDIKAIISQSLKRGRLNIKSLSRRLKMNKSTLSRLLNQIISLVSKSVKHQKSFKNKRRRSNCLFIDETFLNIGKKTWYLIVVVSGNNKIMAVELVKKRTKEKILEIVKNCADRLIFGLDLLVSDGFQVYIGVARDLNQNLTHIRHIHKPPYGRVSIEIYSYEKFEVSKTILKTTNEITKLGGWFIGQVKIKKESLGNKKRGRKKGGKNRPKDVIEAEKRKKQENPKPRGRPPGKMNKNDWNVHVFNHDKKRGRITALGGSSSVVAAAMNTILKQFNNLHITSNLVEKEFSVLKKFIDFRGRRSIELWLELLNSYFLIRDDPKILDKILKKLDISYQMVGNVLPSLISCQIGVMTS